VNAGALSLVQKGAGVAYTDTMLRLDADVPSSADFNFLAMRAAGLTYFRVDGLGDMYLGSTPGGNPLLRIAANGFIQTLEHEDVNIVGDSGQTIYVSAGDAYASVGGGVVGSLVLRAGNGEGNIRGGDISLAGGRADLAPAGHATLRGGDVLSGGFPGGDLSLYAGKGLADADAGTLRLLDGAAARNVVLEARPDYAALSSGGDVSVVSANRPGASLSLGAYDDVDVASSHGNVVVGAANAVELVGATSVTAAAPFVALSAGAALVGAAVGVGSGAACWAMASVDPDTSIVTLAVLAVALAALAPQ
jgi:hypothetical protein